MTCCPGVLRAKSISGDRQLRVLHLSNSANVKMVRAKEKKGVEMECKAAEIAATK